MVIHILSPLQSGDIYLGMHVSVQYDRGWWNSVEKNTRKDALHTAVLYSGLYIDVFIYEIK